MIAIFREPLVRPLFLMSVTSAWFGPLFSALYIFYAVNILRLSPSMLGITIAVGGVGSLIGAAIAGPWMKMFGVGRAILAASLIAGAGAVFIPLAHGSPVMGMGYLMVSQLFGDTFGVVLIIISTSLRQSILPLGTMGRVGAAFRVGVGAPSLLAALLGGWLAEAAGVRPIMYVAVVGMILSTVWAIFSPLWRLTDMPVVRENPVH